MCAVLWMDVGAWHMCERATLLCCCLVRRICFKPGSISGFCVSCTKQVVFWRKDVTKLGHFKFKYISLFLTNSWLCLCFTFVSRFSARSWLSTLLFLQSLKADHVTKWTLSNTCHIWLRISLVHKVLRMSWSEPNAKQRSPCTSIARLGPAEITVIHASTRFSVATITRRQFAGSRTRAVDEQSQYMAIPSANPAIKKKSVSTFLIRR